MVKLGGLNRNSNEAKPASGGASNDGNVTWASKLLVVLLVVVSLAVAGSLGVSVFGDGDAAVKDDQYQAVFLNNGQVYFGKLSDINKPYVNLTDIYYLQVNQQVQPEREGDADQQPQVSLTKLGNELHGPEDAMFIDRDKIVFWENLKDDGRITQAITQLESGEGNNQSQDSQNNNQQQ